MAASKMNSGLLYGLIAAGAAIIFSLVLYILGASYFVHPISNLAFAIPIVFAVLAGIAQKKEQGGYLQFSEALKTVFTVFVLWSFLATTFSYILLNFIDEPFKQAMAQIAAEQTEKWMTKFGAPQKDIDKAVEEALTGNQFNLKTQFLGFAFWSIVWFLVSLIIAAIIKKKKPEFEVDSFNQP